MNDLSDGLTYLVPFWNEKDGVERTITILDSAAECLTRQQVFAKVKILAVDDGSTDGTSELLQWLTAKFERLEVIRLSHNQGIGAALRAGLKSVDTTWIFYTDADLPVDPFVCKKSLRISILTGADIVSCYRFDRREEGLRRIFISLIYNLLVRHIVGLRVRDVNFAAKLIRTASIDSNSLVSNSVFFDAELLARAIKNGAYLQQLGVNYLPRTIGISTLSSLASVKATARDIMTIGREVRIK